jgi:hypothetical protein
MFGSESVVVRTLVQALFQSLNDGKSMQTVVDYWHGGLTAACVQMNYSPPVYKRIKSQYRKAQTLVREILETRGFSSLAFKELFVPGIERVAPDRGIVDISLDDAIPSDDQLDPNLSLLLEDLAANNGDPIYTARSESTHVRQLMDYARDAVMPRVIAAHKGRVVVAPYLIDSTRYLIVITETGRKPLSPSTRFSLNFTVEPYKVFTKAPEDVIVRSSSGKVANVRIELPIVNPDDPTDVEHKYWAQFIIHKPGRKIRVFGSEIVDGSNEWNEIVSVTRRIVMTDERPWYRDVSFEEWRALPTVDKE